MLRPGLRIITGAWTHLYSSNRWPFRSLLFTWELFSHFCGLSFTLIPHLQREYALDSHCFPRPLLHLSNCLKCDRLNRCMLAFGFEVRSYFSSTHILHLPARLLHPWRNFYVVWGGLKEVIQKKKKKTHSGPMAFSSCDCGAGCSKRCCPGAALSPTFSGLHPRVRGLHAENADLINEAGLLTTGKKRENNGVSNEIDQWIM